MPQLIDRLLLQGDFVALEQGQLIIRPKSGKPIPADWLKRNRAALLQQIANSLGIGLCQYLGYSTGCYGIHKAGGVSLRYLELGTGQECYAIFNAGLKRERTTKGGEKGARLPDGHFHPQRAFITYWQLLGLPMPRRLSEFHFSMHHLGKVLVIAQIDAKGKMDKKSMAPASVNAGDLVAVFGGGSAGNSLASDWQGTGKTLARSTGKEMAESLTPQGLAPNLSACTEKCDKRKQGSAINALANTPIGTVLPDHISAWMAQMEADDRRRKLEKT